MARQQELNTPVFWLQEAGFSAYLVGNQVRNRILGVISDRFDVDIATNALPRQVVSVLKKNGLIPTAVDEKFGVVTFHFQSITYESTTFRQDIYRGDFTRIKRYPDAIQFVQVAAEDAPRRDTTISAIYFNPKTGKYLDYHGGLADLKNKMIRMVGEPAVRFQEDPLRLLRAVRLRHELGFKYDPATRKALKAWAHLIKTLSPGVVKKELLKIQALSNYANAKRELQDFGLIHTTN